MVVMPPLAVGSGGIMLSGRRSVRPLSVGVMRYIFT